jgi:hypothetical protein
MIRQRRAICLSAQADPIEQIHEVFRNRLTLEEFKTKVDALGTNKKWKFIRAVLLYQQALKCKDCGPNVAMVLLCSCAEVIKVDSSRGSHYNFRKFYVDYCPSNLQVPPVKYYLSLTPPFNITNASFEEALDYIYSRFRSYFVHQGIGRLELPPTGMTLVGAELMDKFNSKIFVIDTLNVLDWFTRITGESLFKVL